MWGVEFKEGQSTSKPNNEFRFGSPEDYAHLSQEEKEDLTQKMMGTHKAWRLKNKALMDKRPPELRNR